MVYSKKSSQLIYHEDDCPYAKRIIGKYRRQKSEKRLRELGYRQCSYCGGLHGFFLKYVPEQNDPIASYDRKDKALCFRTDVGFWKVLEQGEHPTYRLWHLNKRDFDPNIESKFLMRRGFHRQADVQSTTHMGKIIQYIREHDRAKKIMNDDWRKLPKATSKQRKYYKQAKKRARRNENRRIDELFKKLEKGEL